MPSDLAADWGDNWPRVLADLYRAGLPGETRLLAGFDDALPRQRYLLALTAQSNEPGALRTKAGADVEEIDGAVPDALTAVNEAGDITLTAGSEDASGEAIITPAVLPHGSKPVEVQGSADVMEAQPGEGIGPLDLDMRDVPQDSHNFGSKIITAAATSDLADSADGQAISSSPTMADGNMQIAQADVTQSNSNRKRGVASSVIPRKPTRPSISAEELKRIKSTVPKAPPGVDIDANIAEALRKRGDPFWFRRQVKDWGPWDYKRQSKTPGEFEDFGNYHYGATGAAMGFSLGTLLRMAGRNQVENKRSDPSWGVAPSFIEAVYGVGGIAPFGDQPEDQDQIILGHTYFSTLYPEPNPEPK